MSIIEKIHTDLISARKNKDKDLIDILTFLYSEISTIAKRKVNLSITDSEVIAFIKKVIETNEEVMTLNNSPKLLKEITVFKNYLPEQLSTSDIKSIIMNLFLDSDLRRDKAVMKVVQGYFKNNYDGKYDARIVSDIVKILLNPS